MEFETQEMKMQTSSKYISRAGSPTLDQYEYRVDSNGVKKLVKSDKKEDVHARIQADYDSTDINKLMLRFTLGDQSAIDVREGFYADVTKMPTTYAELFDRAEQAKAYFAELPTDLKEMFNNSPEQFFAEFDSKTFEAKLEKYNDRFKNHDFDAPKTASIEDATVIKEIEHE